MKINVLKSYNFNADEEFNRIEKCFKGDVKKRIYNLTIAFFNGDMEKTIELYNNLPYNDKNECPEQEYVGMAISDFLRDMHWRSFDSIIDIKNKVKKS